MSPQQDETTVLPVENNSPKRLLLYAHFDRDGKVDPHVVYQIQALYDFGISIIFISNSPLSEDDKQILKPFIIDLRLRPDEGYDWKAWKETFISLERDFLGAYNEFIIMNDSCYGPVFPLEEIFNKMDQTKCDFWGITENTDPNFIAHIQPYFCVFKEKLFSSDCFYIFWNSIGNTTTYENAINNGELYMTQYFTQKGYQYSIYIDMEYMQPTPPVGIEHPFVYSLAPWLIRKYRNPFIKIKAFRTAYGKQFNMGQELFIALSDCGSTYPALLIFDHLRRTRPLSWQKNLPGTLLVIDTNAPVLPDPGLKIAVFAHLFYIDQVDEALKWLKNIPYPFDLYVSTTSEKKEASIREAIEKCKELRAQKTEIRIMEDRGRDVAPWLLGFKDVQEKYDIALKFHMKKNPQPNPVFLWEWNTFLMQNTLGSPGYISTIIHEFHHSKQIGFIFHMFPHTPALYFPHLESEECHRCKNDILQRLCATPPEETTQPIFPNNIFWYRPKSLIKLFKSDITIEDFPVEPFPGDNTIAHGLERALPYIAQDSGYYYKLSIGYKYAIKVLQHYEDSILTKNLTKKYTYQEQKYYYKYYLLPPIRIPIGRAFQIAIFSLYFRILGINYPNNKEKKLLKYCIVHPSDIPYNISFYVAFVSLFSHIFNINKYHLE